MMKMATGKGSPLRQGTGTGSRLVFVATEACGGGTPDLGFFLEVPVYRRGVGVGDTLETYQASPSLILARPQVGK